LISWQIKPCRVSWCCRRKISNIEANNVRNNRNPTRSGSDKKLETTGVCLWKIPERVRNYLKEKVVANPDITFFQYLEEKHPEFANLDDEASRRVHAEYVLERTQVIRKEIHEGRMDKCSSQEAFNIIAKIHLGTNPLEHVLAVYEPTHLTQWGLPNLREATIPLGRIKDHEDFQYGETRKTQLSMSRGGGEFMLTVPAKTAQDLEGYFFKTVDDFIEKNKIQPGDGRRKMLEAPYKALEFSRSSSDFT
jgi:hypothetical protein